MDWYQVTQKNGNTMNTIRKIASIETPDPHNYMTGTSLPLIGEFTGPSRRVKPDDKGYIRLTSYSVASPCDPTIPARWSSYA